MGTTFDGPRRDNCERIGVETLRFRPPTMLAHPALTNRIHVAQSDRGRAGAWSGIPYAPPSVMGTATRSDGALLKARNRQHGEGDRSRLVKPSDGSELRGAAHRE